MPLLAMAIAVSVEPFRIGMTVVMINRPRPGLQLLAFLLGGFAMGIAVADSVGKHVRTKQMKDAQSKEAKERCTAQRGCYFSNWGTS